jgi:hypothetical protein
MLKKLSIALSLAAALGLGLAVSVPQPAHAYMKKVVKKHVIVVKKGPPHRNIYVVGRTYNGHIWYGRNRHRWHGRWYAYGAGPCWIKVGGLWFWNVAACP